MPANNMVRVVLAANVGQYIGGMNQAALANQRFGMSAHSAAVKAGRATNGLATIAKSAGAITLAALGGALLLSARAAIQFESSFAGVRKTLDASESQFRILSKSMRELSRTIPINVNELNRIAELGGQLGISVDNIVEFTDTIAKIGVTTTLSTDQAAIGFARLANILQVPQTDFDKMGSSLVELGNNFATTEDQILTFALRIAPVGTTVGLTVDQVLALATAFSSVGIPAERGGTAVQRSFIEMAKAATLGGSELTAFAKTAGMTATEFADTFEENSARAFLAFIIGLGDIQEAGGDVFTVLEDVGLQNQRTMQSLLALAGAGDLLANSLGMSADALGENAAIGDEARKRFRTTESQLSLMKNAVMDTAIELGDHMLPAINNVAKAMQDAFGADAKRLIGSFAGAFEQFAQEASDEWNEINIGANKFLLTLLKIADAVTADPYTSSPDFIGAAKAEVEANLEALRVQQEQTLALRELQFAYDTTGQIVEVVTGNFIKLIEAEALNATYMEQVRKELYLTEDEYRAILADLVDYLTEMGIHEDLLIRLRRELHGTHDSWQVYQQDVKGSTEELRDLVDVLKDLQDAEMGMRSDAFGYIDAMQGLAEAQADLANEDTVENQFALQQAFLSVREAAMRLGPDGIQPLIRNLNEMRLAGVITSEQYHIMAGMLMELDPAFEAAFNATGTLGLGFEDIMNIASETGEEIDYLIGRIYGLSTAMAQSISDVGSFTRFQQSYAAALAGNFDQVFKAGVDFSVVRAALDARNTAASEWNAAGQAWARLAADGFKTASKGSGGITRTAEEAARDAADAFMSSLRAAMSYRKAKQALADAEKAFKDIQSRIVDIAEEINATIKAIEREAVEAAKITLEEEVEILQQQLDILRAEADLAAKRAELASIPEQLAAAETALADALERYNDEMERSIRLGQQHEIAMTDLQANLLATIRAYGLGEGTFADIVDAEAALAEELARGGDAAEVAEQAAEDLAEAERIHAEELERLRLRQIELTLEVTLAEKELILARQELIQLQKDAVGPTQELIDLEEELADLREEQIELQQDLKDAADDLADAELDLVDAYMALMDANGLLATEGKAAAEKFFRAIVSESGASGQAIDRLIAKYRELMTVAGAAPSGGGGGVQTLPSYTSQGTTNIAVPYTGAAPAPLQTGPNTSPTNMMPYILDEGGFIPGSSTTAYPAVVHGGEVIMDGNQLSSAIAAGVAANGGGGSGTIVINLDGREIAKYSLDIAARDTRVARRVS